MTRASDTARLVSGGAVFNEASNDVDFRVESNGDANMFFVDAGNDRIYMGRNATDGVAFARLQIEAQDSEAAISIHRGSNSSGGPGLFFSKSRGATAGDDTVVQDGDELGKIFFSGADGTDRESGAAEIRAEVAGSPGSNDMPGRLIFSTTADGASSLTERMRIDNHGTVLISDTGRALTCRAQITYTGASEQGLIFENTANSASGAAIRFVDVDGDFSGGGIYYDDSNSINYQTTSDYRLKENIVTDWDATTELKKLKPSKFNFKKTPKKTVQGFIAHEVSDIVPEAINGVKDGTEKYIDDEDGKEKTREAYQSIDQSKLVPLLTKSLQEALARIDTLEAEVAKLKG